MAASGRNTSDPNHNPNPAALSSASAALRSQNSMAAAGGNTSDPNPNPNPFDVAASASGATVSASGAASAAPRPQNSKEAPGGNTSDPNPNPNRIDVAEVIPATSPDAVSEFWNLVSTLPEEKQMLIINVISNFIITKEGKVKAELKSGLEELFKVVNEKYREKYMKPHEKEIKSGDTGLVSQDFQAKLLPEIDVVISSLLADWLKVKLYGVLESEIIPAFENICKSMCEEVSSKIAVATSKQDLPILVDKLPGMDGLTSAINVSMNVVLDTVEMHDQASKVDELRRLLSERRFEEVFASVLQKKDAGLLKWLLSKVEHTFIDTSPLSQKTLLQLYEGLSDDIEDDTPRKLLWMINVGVSINKTDPSISEDVEEVMVKVDKRLEVLENKKSIKAMQVELCKLDPTTREELEEDLQMIRIARGNIDFFE